MMGKIYKIFFGKAATEDTGLRGTSAGSLYVDKTVFYKRVKVRAAIQKLKESTVIKQQIEESKIAV